MRKMKKATLLNQQGWVFQQTFLYSKSQLIHGARYFFSSHKYLLYTSASFPSAFICLLLTNTWKVKKAEITTRGKAKRCWKRRDSPKQRGAAAWKKAPAEQS